MAWKDTLLDAAFRGIKFDCVRTNDSIEKDNHGRQPISRELVIMNWEPTVMGGLF